jgi:hypothetical protein
MNQYSSTINIFDDISDTNQELVRTASGKPLDFRPDSTTTMAHNLLPLNNNPENRFQTDIIINGKTRYEEENTIIKSLEEELVTMKHKMSFVYEKDEEIATLTDKVTILSKENKLLQENVSELNRLRLENKQLKDKLDLQTLSESSNDKLESENKMLKDKLKELSNDSDSESIADIDEVSDVMMDVNIPHLRKVLLSRLKDKQTQHIENLIGSYGLKHKNKVKKSIMEKMLEEAIHL